MKFPTSNIPIKTLLSAILAVLMLGCGLHFLLQEGVQLVQVREVLAQSDRRWLYLGITLSITYIWLHGWMYQQSFKALGISVRLRTMIRLYLKRNFVSVFLPAGFLSSQAFFGAEVAQLEKVREREVLAASGIFSAAALLSMVILIAPALGWLLTQHILPGGAIEAFLAVSGLLIGILWATYNFTRHKIVYQWCQRYLPGITAQLDTLDWTKFRGTYFLQAILLSCIVEIVGVFHVYISVQTLGATATFPIAFAGYLAVLVVLMTSPFLRGIGAVEALLAFVLIHFGLAPLVAVSAAVLFRFFEFWLVLLLAVPVLLLRPGNLLVRLAPSALLFLLGVVNIVSSLTPSLPERVHLLGHYLPLDAVHASAALTLLIGFILLVTAFYLFRGLRSAWWLALALSAISLASHLTKGFDYEEAMLALLTMGALLYQKDQYCVRSDFRLVRRSWLPALLAIQTALVLGAIGFYLLNHRHFGADFSWDQSAEYAIKTFFLVDIPELRPLTLFGKEFLGMMHLMGGISILFFAYTVFQPFLPHFEPEESAREKALELVRQYGRSSLDYFKTYSDKQYFFPQNGRSFIAYKSTARYAMALENPVAPDEDLLREGVKAFDRFCRRNGQHSIYYRIPEKAAQVYRSMGKSLLPLGQEAVVQLNQFTLEGKERKALRNTINKMEREGFVFVAHEAPLSGGLLQQLRAVSDNWLRAMHRSELTFSQGIFDEKEIKNQTVLCLEDQEGKILAFINLIPGGSPQEANFDLMRRIEDAPNGTMDFLFTNMFFYLKAKGFSACNLGLVPMSGLDHPSNLSENLLKLAYDRLPRFANYKSLRFFKEKFNPEWETQYVAYDTTLDLVNLSLTLRRVVQT